MRISPRSDVTNILKWLISCCKFSRLYSIIEKASSWQILYLDYVYWELYFGGNLSLSLTSPLTCCMTNKKWKDRGCGRICINTWLFSLCLSLFFHRTRDGIPFENEETSYQRNHGKWNKSHQGKPDGLQRKTTKTIKKIS